MTILTDRIAEVLRLYGDSCTRANADYLAQLVVEALHLKRILVKEGEIPPLYAIEGWIRGPATEEQP